MTVIVTTNMEDALLESIKKLLEAKGYKVIVIGDMRIEQRDPMKRLKFEFVVDFVATNRDPEKVTPKKP